MNNSSEKLMLKSVVMLIQGIHWWDECFFWSHVFGGVHYKDLTLKFCLSSLN